MVAVKLGSAAPVVTLWVDHGHISPQLALVLNDLSGVAFVISWLPFAIFIAAVAAALHRAGLVAGPLPTVAWSSAPLASSSASSASMIPSAPTRWRSSSACCGYSW